MTYVFSKLPPLPSNAGIPIMLLSCGTHLNCRIISPRRRLGSIKLYYLPPPPTHLLLQYMQQDRKVGDHVFVLLGMDFVSSCDLSIGFWKCSYRMVHVCFVIFHFNHSICFSYILEIVTTQPLVGFNKKQSDYSLLNLLPHRIVWVLQ